MTKNKYISFDWWWGGWNNIRMTYELVGSLSYVSGRTIILPPKGYCLFFAEHNNKSTFMDMWDVLDKEKFISQYDCIEYKDSPLAKYESKNQYFENICDDIDCITFGDEPKNWGPQNFISKGLMYHSIESIEHFDKFNIDNRALYNIYSEDEVIHFPRNLFGHFGYHVYPPNDTARKILQQKVKNGIRFKQKFYDEANKLMSGDYDAIHIRRGDFKYVHTTLVEKQYKELPSLLEGRIRKNVPLYIATDEKDLSLFDNLKSEYNIVFLSDLKENIQTIDMTLDTIIASNANIFLGSRMSTFSDYINILRGYNNKKDFSRESLNFKHNNLIYKKYPWESEPYAWHNLWGELYYGEI